MFYSRIAFALLCLTIVFGALVQPGPVADEPPQLHVLFNKLPSASTPADIAETWNFSDPASCAQGCTGAHSTVMYNRKASS